MFIKTYYTTLFSPWLYGEGVNNKWWNICTPIRSDNVVTDPSLWLNITQNYRMKKGNCHDSCEQCLKIRAEPTSGVNDVSVKNRIHKYCTMTDNSWKLFMCSHDSFTFAIVVGKKVILFYLSDIEAIWRFEHNVNACKKVNGIGHIVVKYSW